MMHPECSKPELTVPHVINNATFLHALKTQSGPKLSSACRRRWPAPQAAAALCPHPAGPAAGLPTLLLFGHLQGPAAQQWRRLRARHHCRRGLLQAARPAAALAVRPRRLVGPLAAGRRLQTTLHPC